MYGPDGLSERIIGRWFEAESRRDEVVLATKFGFRLAPGPLGTGASRRRIMRCAEDSLRRLRTDRIDLYQVQVQDYRWHGRSQPTRRRVLMSENEIARLKGEVFALKHVLIATLSAVGARTPDIVGIVIRHIKAELSSGPPAHVTDVLFLEPEERTAYTDMLEETEEALEGL